MRKGQRGSLGEQRLQAEERTEPPLPLPEPDGAILQLTRRQVLGSGIAGFFLLPLIASAQALPEISRPYRADPALLQKPLWRNPAYTAAYDEERIVFSTTKQGEGTLSYQTDALGALALAGFPETEKGNERKIAGSQVLERLAKTQRPGAAPLLDSTFTPFLAACLAAGILVDQNASLLIQTRYENSQELPE